MQSWRAAFDLLGFLTLTGGLVVMLLGLTQGQTEDWTSPRILSLFGTPPCSLRVFIVAELRAEHPYVHIRYFRNLNFSISSMIVPIRVMGFRGTSFILNLFLQKALFYSPLQAGIFMLPAAVAVGIVSPFAGMLPDRFGPSILLVTGLVLLAVTLFSLANVTISTGVGVIYFLVILKSIGQSSINAPLNSIALGALPEGESRMGSGILGLARGLGEAFGIATLSFLLERHIFYKVEAMTPGFGARLAENLHTDVMLQIRALLQHAGQFGIGLEQRAESLLGFSLLTEGVTLAYQQLFVLIGLMYLGLVARGRGQEKPHESVNFFNTVKVALEAHPVLGPIRASSTPLRRRHVCNFCRQRFPNLFFG